MSTTDNLFELILPGRRGIIQRPTIGAQKTSIRRVTRLSPASLIAIKV